METNTTATQENANKVSKREKTVSLTAVQITEIANSKELGKLIVDQIELSEGNLKGNMAFNVAKAMAKQLKIKL